MSRIQVTKHSPKVGSKNPGQQIVGDGNEPGCDHLFQGTGDGDGEATFAVEDKQLEAVISERYSM